MVFKKLQNKGIMFFFYCIGIETGNLKESETISMIGVEIRIDKIQTILNARQKSLISLEISSPVFVVSGG